MNRRLAFAWWWGMACLLAIPAAAQAPLELDHGEQISISCAPAPPACPPSCGDGTCDAAERCTCTPDCGMPPMIETACADGIDDDCDTLTDCADGDCSADPACAPSSGPPAAGLVFRHDYRNGHAVEPGVFPVETICMGCAPAGKEVHHLLGNEPGDPLREATEVDPRWWPTIEADGIRFDGDDQLLFQRCTSLDPLICEYQDWRMTADDAWAVYFVGEFGSAGYFLGYPNEPGVEYSYINIQESGGWKIRIEAGLKMDLGHTPFDTRLALVIERQADRALKFWKRLPCGGWIDGSIGAVAQAGKRPGFGCWSCYSANETKPPPDDLSPGMFTRFREGGGYQIAFDATSRAELFAHLDRPVAEGGHREWIDEACPP
jgi:hypothetical protein